jgi:DNA-binding transcriptional ArsR family regulator
VLLPALVEPEAPAAPEPAPAPAPAPVRVLVPLGRFDWERVVRDWPFDRQVTKLSKYVALTMATYANADGTNIRPGEPGLATATGMGRSTVRRHLAVLVEIGLISCTRRGGGGAAAHYRLTAPEGYELRSLR